MAQLQPKEASTGRLYYLDNFRTYLTVLVIFHHTAVAYGGIGGWFYRSKFHPEGSSDVLISFNVINQSYFMASFFFLSGLMSSRALKRKSKCEFLRTKYVKLGIPVIVYTLFGGPAQIALSKLHKHEELSLGILTEFWESLRGICGPVWYPALLLIFDTIYALVPDSASFIAPPFLIGIFLDVAGNFGMRLLFPAGDIFVPLNLKLGYLVQYITSYLLGIRFAAFDSPSSQPLLSASPTQIPLPKLTLVTRTILLASCIISNVSLIGLLHYYPDRYPRSSVLGGLNLAALSYAFLNETTGYLLGSAILTVFKYRSLFNRSWGSVGRYSYAAFVVHPIVCVGAQLWTDDWNASGVLKTAVIGTIGALGSWAIGWALVRVPKVDMILL
jgi:glucan biosynthesis protein C